MENFNLLYGGIILGAFTGFIFIRNYSNNLKSKDESNRYRNNSKYRYHY